MNGVKTVYVCGVEWQHEWNDCDDIHLYPSAEALMKDRTCWKKCGIVKVKIAPIEDAWEWVKPQDFSFKKEDK